MVTFLRLQHRRLLAVWLTVISLPVALISCGCIRIVPPEGVSTSALLFGFGWLFLISLVPVAIAFVLIWMLPGLRCILDMLLPIAILVPLMKSAMSASVLPDPAQDAVGIGLLFLLFFGILGGRLFGRGLWFAYRGTGRVLVPGLPEEIWPHLVPNDVTVARHFVPNLLSVTQDPADRTRMQARYAMQRGTVLTMVFTNVRQEQPLSFSYEHTGDSPILKGALATGSFRLQLTKRDPSSTELRIHVATGPLPPLVVLTLWLDNMAQDQAQMALEAVTGKGRSSIYRRAMAGMMKTYRRRNPT